MGNKLTTKQQLSLLKLPNKNEIKQALFEIKVYKSPGPDGYGSGFFKAAWEVIGEDVIEAIWEFFVAGNLLKHTKNTLISVITKIESP